MSCFKNFLLRGNLIELAVAVIVGVKFNEVVTAFTQLLLELVAKVIGQQPNFDKWTPGGVHLGAFFTVVIAFLILATVVYFFVVLPYTKAKERSFPAETGGKPADVALLEEIRDLLATRNGSA